MTLADRPPATAARLEEQFSKLKAADEDVHQLLQACTMFGHLMEEINFIKSTLDISLANMYQVRGSVIANHVREFVEMQPSPSSTDFAISNFQKHVTECYYQYSRIYNHFKTLYETVKPETSESANLMDDMVTFYEQRHHPVDAIASAYIDITASGMVGTGDYVKRLTTEVRDLTQNDPVAPFDPKPDLGSKAEPVSFQDVIASPLLRAYFHQFLDSQISGENLLFWDEVRRFRDKSNSFNKEELRRQVDKIVARFLSIGGENEINVSAAVRESIMDNIEEPTPEIFEAAVNEVYAMMHGAFPGFEQSFEYKMMQHRRRKAFLLPVATQKADADVLPGDVKMFQKSIRSVHQLLAKVAPPSKKLSGSGGLRRSKDLPVLVTGNATKPSTTPLSPTQGGLTPKGPSHCNLGAQVNCMSLVDNYLWVGLNDSICVFNPLAMQPVKTMKHPGKVHSIIQATASEVWTASDGGGPIKCWDSEKFKNSKDVMTGSFIKGEVVTYMAKIRSDMIWVGTMSGMIRIWTIPKRKMVHEMKVGNNNPVWYMIAQESSSSVWVAHGDDITRFHSVSYRKGETFPKEHSAHVTSMVLTEQFYNKNNLSSITTVLWTGSLDGCVCLWDTETLKCIQKFHGHTDAVLHLSQSKLYVFSSSFDRTTISWDKHNPSKVRSFSEGHTGPVTCSLALGRVSGGSSLWTGSQDATIRAWPLE
eukprot:GHVU01125381.1.p1 GENE.GHVU01125381.1~~GHVU01125381.1.p1  ORF type:complete len:704 (+),score=77.20 GHVU01125381.1:1-2112(+)